MKHTLLPITLAFAVACVPAFAAPRVPAVKDQASTAKQDTAFLKKASQGNVDEVDLGQQALQKSDDQQVKEFAQKLVDDHTALQQKMAPFAAEAGLETPTSPDAEAAAEKVKLDVLKGKAYDKEFVRFNIKDHAKDLAEFRKEIATTGYPAFKTALVNGEQVIREHLEIANKLGKSMGLTPAPMPPDEK